DLDERRLARAVLAEQRDDFASADLDSRVGECLCAAELLRDAVHGEQGLSRRRSHVARGNHSEIVIVDDAGDNGLVGGYESNGNDWGNRGGNERLARGAGKEDSEGLVPR